MASMDLQQDGPPATWNEPQQQRQGDQQQQHQHRGGAITDLGGREDDRQEPDDAYLAVLQTCMRPVEGSLDDVAGHEYVGTH
jgi:hypothetical protein